ncbi:hypothetical protein [Streptococcus merionis]|nr:hypothetical protein [Streptococcus merionis]
MVMNAKVKYILIGLSALFLAGFGIFYGFQNQQARERQTALARFFKEQTERQQYDDSKILLSHEIQLAELSYMETFRLDGDNQIVDEDRKVFKERYEELSQKKKDGQLNHIDLVHFTTWVSPTELPSVRKVALTELYFQYKYKQFQSKAGPASSLDTYYIDKDGVRLTYGDFFSDGKAFADLAKAKMLEKGFTQEEADGKMAELLDHLDVNVFDPRADRLCLNYDDKLAYLEFPYSEMKGIIADQFLSA